MGDEDGSAPTRRAYVKYSGAIVGGGLLAGCNDENTEGNSSPTAERGETTTTETPSPTTRERTGTPDDPTESDDVITVEMAPVGRVTFDEPPENWLAMTAGWADMGLALGRDPPEGLTSTSRYHTHHYDDIPGVSVDTSAITQLYDAGIDKELFYEFDADVHVFDPNFLTNRVENFGDGDVAEIADTVAPFVGNTIFSRNYGWHDGYRYYTMYEAFEKLARVFDATDRYEAFGAYHDEVIADVRDRLPSAGERPSVGLLMVASEEPDEFYPFRIEEGTGWKQWRDLEVRDGLAGTGVETFTAAREPVDYELLLEADPDYLMLYGYESLGADGFRETFLPYFRDHEVASQLTAVQNGDVYRAGGFYQGPIINLALTERAAKQVYPDEFDADERLYDRERIAEIVAGGV